MARRMNNFSGEIISRKHHCLENNCTDVRRIGQEIDSKQGGTMGRFSMATGLGKGPIELDEIKPPYIPKQWKSYHVLYIPVLFLLAIT